VRTPGHIAVIRLSALGDVAMTVPVLRVLRSTYPELKITVISNRRFQPLFETVPEIQFIGADLKDHHKGVGGLLRLAGEITECGADALADLHNVIRSKIVRTALRSKALRIAVIDKGRAEKKMLVRSKGGTLTRLKSTHLRYADVFAKLGYPLDLSTHQYPQRPELGPRLSNLFSQPPRKCVGIAPFAAFPSKMYPLESMRELLKELNDSSRFDIFLFGGGEAEEHQLKELARGLSGVKNLANQLTFSEELNLMANLDLMVAMDSGNGHLAAMFSVPVITLWGVTHPAAGFTPFNQDDQNQVLSDRKKYPLIPTSIYGNRYPEGYEHVMESISVETIIRRINQLLHPA
jgi:ADP-heptose:LPS heptosyltransferase